MKFVDLQAGQAIFIDANILVYYYRPDPVLAPPCDQLLRRVENQEIQGFTSAHVLSELAHRLMTDEASQRFGWSMTGIARRLRNHPAQMQGLTRHRHAIDDLSLIGIQILPVTGAQVSIAADLSCQHGLLSSDALIVAVMRDHGLTFLASHDTDFDRIPGVTHYAPI